MSSEVIRTSSTCYKGSLQYFETALRRDDISNVVVRLLLPNERMADIITDRYSPGGFPCIAMKRWLFNTKLESRLCKDETALNYIFWEVCYANGVVVTLLGLKVF